MFLDRFFKRPPLDLYVSHYYRGHITADQHFPFHRALFIATDPTSDPPKGNLYQVHAVAGRFKYFQQSNVTVSLPDSFAGMVKVGEIRPPDLRIVEAIIQEVPIEDDPEVYWSGQEWTRDAVRRLAKGGFIDLALLSKLYHTLDEQETEYTFAILRDRLTPRHSMSPVPSSPRTPLTPTSPLPTPFGSHSAA